MKQKIVIQVAMHGDNCRSKALKIAAAAQGVSSVALEGDKDRVVVIGDNVDSVCLAKSLRKKFSHASIVSVEEVKEEKKENKKDDTKDEKEESKPKELPLCHCPPSYVVCDQYPNNNCTFM